MSGRIALEELNRELDAARANVEAWADAKIGSAGELRRKHAKLVSEHKSAIASLQASQQSLAHEAEQVKQKLAAEDSEQAELQAEVRSLEAAESQAEGQLQALQGEVSGKAEGLSSREANLVVQQEKAAAKLVRLQQELHRFSERLGLSFEHSSDVEGELCVVFTALDPADADRKFVVGIRVPPSQHWQVSSCRPQLPGIEECQRALNETGDFGGFVRAVRAQFRQLVAQQS